MVPLRIYSLTPTFRRLVDPGHQTVLWCVWWQISVISRSGAGRLRWTAKWFQPGTVVPFDLCQWRLEMIRVVLSDIAFQCMAGLAKLWNELDTKLKKETSPTQFKSLLKLVLMIKLYSDYWFVTASYILYYGWCLCRPVLVFSPALHFFATFLLFFIFLCSSVFVPLRVYLQ